MRFSGVAFTLLSTALVSTAGPLRIDRRAAFTKANGAAAKALNAKFATLSLQSSCQTGENACIKDSFAQCVDGKFVLTPCAGGLKCSALPLVNKPGTSIACTTEADADARIANTGVKRGLTQRDSEIFNTLEARAELSKRIAQTDLPAVAQSWQKLCLASGADTKTGNPCVTLAGVNGINGLLAGTDPCAQQDNADAMVDFAKRKGVKNKAALIANAVAYRKHPRNALNIGGTVPSTPFCQKAPRNAELKGLVNAQLNGVNPNKFGGPNFKIVDFGQPGTCPFGKKPDVKARACR